MGVGRSWFRDEMGSFEERESEEEEVVKKHRGPTMLFDVHASKWEDRVAILFNEKNQPIRPTNDDSKYTVPPSAEKWVMQSIRDSWRVFKCRIKKDHYYKYDNDADRWKNRPSRVPEPHFKEISAKNFENHKQQENMHITGNKRIKELESSQESGLDNDSDIDPFDNIMGKKEHYGRLRLCGRGISSKDLNRNDKGSSPFTTPQLVDAIKSSLTVDMQNDLTAHKEKLKNEYNARQEIMEAEKEKLNQVLEVECAKVVDMQKELEAQKAKLDDVVPKALAQLQKLVPGITLQIMAQAFASSVDTTSDPLTQGPNQTGLDRPRLKTK
ncbi:hypothetical protein Cgig2_023469 [Carnegiea gigantea]|uniref:Uncharacterized protein n=1 Tax=Carnegiea gigantea TaxID=171969 RepID=A0A9Q1K6H9_9CARY|nr:hypothetical protein Cgig2_023469 [Carnegiea gigantea]